MKWIFSLLLTVGMLLLLCACSPALDPYTESEEVADMLDGADGDYALSTGATIPSETLIEDGKFLVRVTGLSGTLYFPRLNLVIDKGKYQSMNLDIDYALVNGWQVGGTTNAYDEAYLTFHNYASRMRRFSAYMQLSTSVLYECGLLEDIRSISVAYSLTADPGDNSGDKIYEGVYSAATSAAGEPEEYVCDGLVLLDAADVKVQLFSLKNGSTAGDVDVGMLILYTENQSDERVAVTIADVACNGETAYVGTADGNLISGARALLAFELGAFARPIAVEDGDEVTFTLTVYDYDAYCESDPEDETILPPPLAVEEISLTVGED